MDLYAGTVDPEAGEIKVPAGHKITPAPPTFEDYEKGTPEPPILPRAQVLREAEALCTGSRNAQYGPPTQDFERTAALWSILFEREFKPHEVAVALACVKLSRIAWTPGKRDSWVDLAGYAACGWECVE